MIRKIRSARWYCQMIPRLFLNGQIARGLPVVLGPLVQAVHLAQGGFSFGELAAVGFEMSVLI